MDFEGNLRVFGVVGDPVAQIKTPSFINPIFERLGTAIVALPLHVSAEDFPEFWIGARAIKNLVGFGVTVPHKKTAFGLCDSVGENAKKIGVVNVVRRRPDGSMHGDIFDGASFVSGLIAEGHSVGGKTVYMVGAGGAATAIAFALVAAGINRLFIQNRSEKNATLIRDKLAELEDFRAVEIVHEFQPQSNIVINATSLGMSELDALPLDVTQLMPSHVVAEVVAKPEMTALLSAASQMGCQIHTGLHMIINQMEILAHFVTEETDET